MSWLLIEVLKASASMFTIALTIYAIYLYARRKTSSKLVGDKLNIYACGESLPERKASVADVNLFTALWKDLFKSLYFKLRESIHTGVLSDWLFWMSTFLAILLTLLVSAGGFR